MIVYGLAGKAGTGKSFNAFSILTEYNIEALIDDGLLIIGGDIIAGISAKKQKTKVTAIKTAIFTNEENRLPMIEAIKKNHPESILIIGTSEKMVHIIASRLKLPEPTKIIDIEHITTEGERKIAKKQRKDHGRHVIPAPTVKVRKTFSGFLIHPIAFLFGHKENLNTNKDFTIIRPTFSYLGDFKIGNNLIEKIILLETKKYDGLKILSINIKDKNQSLKIKLSIKVPLKEPIMELCKTIQKDLYHLIENMTALKIEKINFEVY